MKPASKKSWILKQRPASVPNRDDVDIVEVDIPETLEGQVLIETTYFSLDPAIRGWMSDTPSYLPPIGLGDPIRASVTGVVVESKSPNLSVGDRVYGTGGWETFCTGPAEYFSKIPDDAPFPDHYYLSIFGAVGLTPYFGLLSCGDIQPGQTLLMSAAAGAVGSIGGQIAKIKGLRVVGLAGSEDKCNWVTDELGFDASINYKTCGDLETAIRSACPEGVDVFFDNVGGETLDAALLNLNKDATVVFCGSISTYNSSEPVPGPYNWWQVLARSVTVKGYLISDYVPRFGEGQAQLAEWVQAGQIQFKEHIVDGFDNCLDAYNLLFEGKNTGKLMVKV